MLSFNLVISILFILKSAHTVASNAHECQLDPSMCLYPDYICSINKYNLFAVQWKAQQCYKKNYTNCFNENIPNITIHGIWQNYYTESWPYCPQCCYNSTNSKLNLEHLESIKQQLDIFWPSYSNDPNFEFWTHEWCKHGTCWNIVNQFEYFQTGLNWLSDYNHIEQVLADSNIFESNTKLYPINDVRIALEKGLKFKVAVACNKQYISEFYMCRDWFGTPIDCPDILKPKCEDMVYLTEMVHPTECRAIDPRATDQWCNDNCNHDPPYCPQDLCKCETLSPIKRSESSIVNDGMSFKTDDDSQIQNCTAGKHC